MERGVERKSPADPIVNLGPTVKQLRELVTEALCDEVFYDVRDKERQRNWSLHSLAWFWISVTLQAPKSLSEAMAQVHVRSDPYVPPVESALSSFFKRCQTLDAGFFSALYHRVACDLEDHAPRCFGSTVAHLKDRFAAVKVIDGSTLDRIAHRLKILQTEKAVVLPGALTAVYDLFLGYATQLDLSKDAAASELLRGVDATEVIPRDTLLVGDRLYCNTLMFEAVTANHSFGLFRYNKSLHYRKIRRLSRRVEKGELLEDFEVEIGSGPRRQRVRLIRLKRGRKVHRAMTSVLDPDRLSAEDVVELYPLRWKVERLFHTLKVVLNLKKFHAANPNAVAMQVYAAAMVHAVFRTAQGHIAEKLHMAPEEISTQKLFPKLAIAAYGDAIREEVWNEVQAQLPAQKILRPRWSRFRWAKTRLSDILRQRRKNTRKKRRYSKQRTRWKSLRHVRNGSRLTK